MQLCSNYFKFITSFFLLVPARSSSGFMYPLNLKKELKCNQEGTMYVVPFFSKQTSIYVCVLGLTSPKKCNNFAQFAQEEKKCSNWYDFLKNKVKQLS